MPRCVIGIAAGASTLRGVLESHVPEEMLALAQRVRRALTRWPLTELDPIERAELAAELRDARSFEDLSPGWQQMLLESEAGAPRDPREFHLHLRGDQPGRPD
jgi:hypothetical protein